MTRELSTDWCGRGVRVNEILPALVINPSLTERMQVDKNHERQFRSGRPVGRMGQPEVIADLAVFLASDSSSWINDALIPLDGGNLALKAGGPSRLIR